MTHQTLRACLLALVLAAFAGIAHAQVDYQLYGVADLSYGRFEPSGLVRKDRLNSNSLSASFVGGNVKYGFENAWTAGVTLEAFYRFQDLKLGRTDNDPILSRNNFVSLTNPDFGLVRVGRLQTSLFDTTVRFNALGNAIAFSPTLRHVFLAGNLESVQGDFYWDRAVSYSTPSLAGVTFNVMHSKLKSDLRGGLDGGSLVISQGLFAMALSAQRVKSDDGFSDPVNERTAQIGMLYNFGLVRVFGQYTTTRDRGLDVSSKTASAGASLALGPGNVLFQIAHTKAEGLAVDRRHTSTTGGYQWGYDSVTDIYLLAMDDRVRDQTRGVSVAVGIRYRF